MKIAFITSTDPRNIGSFSGTHSFMLRALEDYGHRVNTLGPLKSNWLQIGRVVNKGLRVTVRRGTNPIHSWRVAAEFAAQLQKRLDGAEVIFAPASSTAIAALETDIPIVYYTDLTFDQIHRGYDKVSGLTHRAIVEGNEIERAALNKATIAVFPSEWALTSAIKTYGVNGDKAYKVLMGANLENVPEAHLVTGRLLQGECKVLFVGVDWVRKGGQIALDAVRALRAQGIPSQLTVCGCVPPMKDACMRVFPFLRKNVSSERDELARLFQESHFFVLPTRSDAFPIVLAEASAYGLPCLSSRTGGLEDLVTEGENGFLLPLSSTGLDYASRIAEIWADRAKYAWLETSSRQHYDDRLNWGNWARQISTLFSLVAQTRCPGLLLRDDEPIAHAGLQSG
jgi:glycosyltransferase involved in cell wall biosynthesis